jgi:hypothetical protein
VTKSFLRLASPTTAAVLGLLAVLLTVADIPIELVSPAASPSGSDVWSNVTWFVFGLAFIGVGVVVARREPRNRIGWLLIAAALTLLLSSDGASYGYIDYRLHHGALPLGSVALLLAAGFFYTFLLVPLIILLFPEGRLGPRWRWPVRAYLTIAVAYIAGSISVAVTDFRLRVPIDASGNLVGLNHPRGANHWVGPVSGLSAIAAGLLAAAAVVYQLRRYRRASGEARQQLKWLGAGATTCIVSLAIALAWSNSPDWVGNILYPLGLLSVPITIAVGILRYRLYEIDRLVSRTLAYALLTALLVGTFIGLVALTTNTLALSGRVGVAASTLVAAALFNPLRVRLQRLVDRRFNRAHYNAEATVAAFTARLRDAVEIDAIRADLLDAVNRAVQPTQASIWIKP